MNLPSISCVRLICMSAKTGVNDFRKYPPYISSKGNSGFVVFWSLHCNNSTLPLWRSQQSKTKRNAFFLGLQTSVPFFWYIINGIRTTCLKFHRLLCAASRLLRTLLAISWSSSELCCDLERSLHSIVHHLTSSSGHRPNFARLSVWRNLPMIWSRIEKSIAYRSNICLH